MNWNRVEKLTQEEIDRVPTEVMEKMWAEDGKMDLIQFDKAVAAIDRVDEKEGILAMLDFVCLKYMPVNEK